MKRRETQVAMISRLNGAYLIYLSGVAWEEETPQEQFTCASSLRKAKRIAKDEAINAGYTGPFQWNERGDVLTAMWDAEAVAIALRKAHARAYGYDDEEEADE